MAFYHVNNCDCPTGCCSCGEYAAITHIVKVIWKKGKITFRYPHYSEQAARNHAKFLKTKYREFKKPRVYKV